MWYNKELSLATFYAIFTRLANNVGDKLIMFTREKKQNSESSTMVAR